MTCVENPELDDAEIARRRDEALLRALNTPPKPHSAMKLGKRKAKASLKASPPKKPGRLAKRAEARLLPGGNLMMQSPLVEDIPSPAGDEMQRNMDLIRELLLKLEALPMKMGDVVSIPPDAEEIAVPGYDLHQIDYHLTQIRKAGFIDEAGANPLVGIGFCCLTPAGHDFLDSVRDPETWARTKKAAAGAGGFTIDLLRDLAKGFVKKQIEEKTGIKL